MLYTDLVDSEITYFCAERLGEASVEYKKLPLKETLSVTSLVSVHYLEYTRDFAFSGELHDFWEFVYVDKGRVYATAGSNEFQLSAQQFYLHKPMEFHNIRCDGTVAANAIVISFDGNCPALQNVAGRILTCPEESRPLLASIIGEAREAFSTPLGDPNIKELLRNNHQPFASEQLIRLYLEEFLIKLVRNNWHLNNQASLPTRQFSNQRLKAICAYLEDNVENRIMFEDVCRQFSIGASALKKLFRDNVGCGVMEYYGRCKIERAKQMIREREMNYTQIADTLHYTTVQYFSRHFKRCTQMTPSEYADSVKRYMDHS